MNNPVHECHVCDCSLSHQAVVKLSNNFDFPLGAGFSLLHEAKVERVLKLGVLLNSQRCEDGELFVRQHQRHHLVLEPRIHSLGD